MISHKIIATIIVDYNSPEAFSDQVRDSKAYENAGAALCDTFSKGHGHCWSDIVACSSVLGWPRPMKLKFSVLLRRLDITDSRFVVRLRKQGRALVVVHTAAADPICLLSNIAVLLMIVRSYIRDNLISSQ